MKDRILALIAERQRITCAEIISALKLPQSTVSRTLTELKNSGDITFKSLAHGRKVWSIAKPSPVVTIQPYVIEKTLHRGKEITSLFEAV